MIGVFLDYYDIAYETCDIDGALERRLGYNKIFIANKDIKIVDGNSYSGKSVEDSIFISSPKANILAVLKMSPKAVVFPDSRIDRKVMKSVAERGVMLCMPLSNIMTSYGLKRSRSLYMMSKLFDYARSKKIEVSFVTLARSNNHLCSYMQLAELAKLIGADDAYARRSIGETNRSLVVE